jgi:AraC-like DNA-binding protein
VSRDCHVLARFCAPPPELARYFTSFYLAEIDVPSGGVVVDYLHPEWANLRFASGYGLSADNHRGDSIRDCAFAVTGASSHALRFEVKTCRIWGAGLMPLGWAKFVGAPAGDYADALVDGFGDSAFANFAALANNLFGLLPDADAELARIIAHFRARLAEGPPDDDRVMALHAAMIDPQVGTVADLSGRTGISQRTIERISRHAFGFSPKLLLRRQRFIRSLAQYMLDPSLRWIGALDGHYHDQSQFVREFRQFMAMNPRDYAKADHPILTAFVKARALAAGAPMQTLDGPQGAALQAQ